VIPVSPRGRELVAERLSIRTARDRQVFARKIHSAIKEHGGTRKAAKALGVAARSLFRWKREFAGVE
jgi:hypothetical protein